MKQSTTTQSKLALKKVTISVFNFKTATGSQQKGQQFDTTILSSAICTHYGV
jgi:hypothetical protein